MASTSVAPEGALPVALCPGRPCPAGGPICGSGPGEEAEAGWLEVAWACSYAAGRLIWAAWCRLAAGPAPSWPPLVLKATPLPSTGCAT